MLRDTCATLLRIEKSDQVDITIEKFVDETATKPQPIDHDDDRECSSILSAISNEEASIASEILDQRSFCPRKNSDGEDENGHIGHIDSPETDTNPNSDIIHGESLMDDISSMLGEVLCGYDADSVENTCTDDMSLFHSDLGKDLHQIGPLINNPPLASLLAPPLLFLCTQLFIKHLLYPVYNIPK